MKTRMKLETKVAPKVKQRITLVKAAIGIALVGVAGFITFLYLNLGQQEDTYAQNQNYNSSQTGDWVSSSTWSGNTPPTSGFNRDNVNINSGHTVTRTGDIDVNNQTAFNINGNGTLIILGDLDVNNNLTLNVNGQLIISGNLTTNNGASITVNGGGSVDISGNASFGNNATFMVDGTLNIEGTLSMGNGYSFSGNGVATVGGSGCDNYWNDGSSGTCLSNTTLPVELLSFAAKPENGGVVVIWETATELNNDFFTIERSTDGTGFEAIATINGNGTTQNVSSYEYIDDKPVSGLSYYRLVQTDFDGTTETFRPVSVEAQFQTGNAIEIFPNPLLGSTLRVKMDSPEEGSLQIVDQNGNQVFAHALDGFRTEEEMYLPGNRMAGIYFVNVKTESASKSFKLVKR